MQVQSSTAATTNASSATSTSQTPTATPTLGYNDFLTLLVAQMQNQDPTNPADPTQFVAELASFSSVEQGVQTNTKLDSLITTSQINQAEAAIGRTITSADGSSSGTVVSVTVGSSGVVATTDTGLQIPISSGVTLS